MERSFGELSNNGEGTSNTSDPLGEVRSKPPAKSKANTGSPKASTVKTTLIL